MIPWIITNHNQDKIEVISEYDEKVKVMRIDVREKKTKSTKKSLKGLGKGYDGSSEGYVKAKEAIKRLRKLK